MSVRTFVAGPAVAAGLLLGACSGSSDPTTDAPSITLNVNETDYQTVPPATTTTTIAGAEEDGAISGTQEYVVQAGDVPVNVAARYNISLEDLSNLNGWAGCTLTACGQFPFPGETIVVPATGGTTVTADPSPADPAADTDTAVDTGEVGEPIPTSGDNCEAGSYVIASGDIPITVAEQFDVTLEELNAANATNPSYTSFIVGETIVIPAC